MTTTNLKHWKLERDDDGIAWLHLDKQDAGANVLSAEVLEELDHLLGTLTAEPARAVVILSDKKSGFIAGADVTEFQSFDSEEAALKKIRYAHSIFDTLAALPCPTIALIDGFCLGGGLEMSLACRYRIAVDDPATRIGLPEVRLGIHPGFGGTVRMIQTIGPVSGLDLMLSGRSLSARAARRIGLVNYAVPRRHALKAAREVALSPPQVKPLSFFKTLPNLSFLRPLLGKYLVKKVSAKAPRAHYPAPYAIIDLWVRYFDNPRTMLEREAASVASLIVGRTAQNLIRVFLLQEQLKALAKDSDYTVKHVHVIGAGVMGADIAAWCAFRGMTVTIQDRAHKTLARAVKTAHKLFKRRLKDRLLIQAAMDRFVPDLRGDGLRSADVVIEAIFEDVKVKQDLFRSIEGTVRPDAILATNTSSIPLAEIGKALKDPTRLIGLHFFNPVAKMPLVEVVHDRKTAEEYVSHGAAFTKAIGKLPLPVTSTPGFLVNRVLMPYLIEAVTLYSEGVPPLLIDRAATKFGMPMGPIELADTVGLDICLHVAEILSQSMDIDVPQRLKDMVERGDVGKKSGKGFYTFKNGKPIKPSPDKRYVAPTDIQDRLICRYLNEAVACLHDKVVANRDHLDAGMIFGTGFAPFRGGPMKYIDTRGVEQLLLIMESLREKHGERFTPHPAWKQLQAEEENQ
ncbi:MAG TPA: crotonase [Gammaproteobacteria bacterium]|nr:crotonase [Gammaproteobacteria bacterium]